MAAKCRLRNFDRDYDVCIGLRDDQRRSFQFPAFAGTCAVTHSCTTSPKLNDRINARITRPASRMSPCSSGWSAGSTLEPRTDNRSAKAPHSAGKRQHMEKADQQAATVRTAFDLKRTRGSLGLVEQRCEILHLEPGHSALMFDS